MASLATTFLNQIANEIFIDNALVQEWTFKYRFNPDYKDCPHSYSQRIDCDREPQQNIADLITKEIGGDYQNSITQQIGAVVQKIYQTHQVEMEQDGITEDRLRGRRGGGRGENAPWRVTYRWLWNNKYPRWSQDYIWDSWKEQAENSKDWIQFSDREEIGDCFSEEYAARGMVRPAPEPKETLPIDTPLNLAIDIDSPGSYMLLFNRGQNKEKDKITKYLVAPSQAFAPSYELASEATLMPQKDSMMHEHGIMFDTESEEEYLGIVIEDPLNLPWLNPDPENPVLEWQGKHLTELWDKLHRQGNWQVFYRDFKVVA
ncbi:MAG: hypothetical protein AAFY63_00060 [Cyanobacteria bacterium J06643_13]